MLPWRVQRTTQQNRWLYSIKLVGTENKRNQPCGVHRRIGKKKGVYPDQYTCITLCAVMRACMCVHVCVCSINPFSTRPHQNVVWHNNSWLGFLKILQKMSPHLSQINVAMAHRNYLRCNNLWILKLATYTKIEDHSTRCKLATF